MQLLNNKRWLAIIASLATIILISLYWLKEQGWIIIPEIESVRMYQQIDYAFGSPEFFHLPRPYSRFWDIVILPFFLGIIVHSGRRSLAEANPWILALTMLIILTLAYCFGSGILSLYTGALFTAVCGLVFGDWTAVLMSLTLGLIVGLVAFGLLFGFIISILTYLAFLGISHIAK